MRIRPLILVGLLLASLSAPAAPGHRMPPSRKNVRTTGESRIPVVLIQFKDVHFVTEEPAAYFGRLLNGPALTEDGASGSVRDFYVDNSDGRYSPSFDVYGPVTLEKNASAYGNDILENGVRVDDAAPERALYEAFLQLDESVDFSVYDADEDQELDLVLYFFAGHDQVNGAPAWTLWSHFWDVQDTNDPQLKEALFDGLRLGRYICTAELAGKEGTTPAGIGTTCHELGHYLGLPDFYDTDGAQNGYTGGLYGFSPMAWGLNNDEGRTPPYFTALERQLLGWRGEIPLLPEGPVRLLSAREGDALQSPSSTEGEFFLYEYRDGKGWDAALPAGLAVYRIDRSGRLLGEYTALERWNRWQEDNTLNSDASHPLFHLIPAAKPASLEYDVTLLPAQMVYPGLREVTFLDPLDWEGQYTDYQLTAISLEADALHMTVLKGLGANINGRVYTSSGRPLEGVSVALEGVEGANAVSGADGFFLLDIPEGENGRIFTLLSSKEGFQNARQEVSLDNQRMKSLSLHLNEKGEAQEFPLTKYDRHAQMGYFSQPAVLGGVRFTAQELFPYVGQLLREIRFYPYVQASFAGDVYVVVDVGRERVLTRKVETLNKGYYFQNSIDIADAGIIVPEGEDIYVGYGSDSPGAFFVGTVYPAKKGNSFYSAFSPERSAWQDMYVKSAGIYMDVALTAQVVEQEAPESLTDLGYAFIDPGKGNYKDGDILELKVHTPSKPLSVTWTLDGESIQADSLILKQGSHSLQARVLYGNGHEEVVELSLKVD